jgi:PadR family transcriptional regulator PadR
MNEYVSIKLKEISGPRAAMKDLTRKEELIMLSILNLRSDAYLVAITDHLSRITSHPVTLTSVHVPLARLERAGCIDSELGEATAVRGGRRKKIYRITKAGFRALAEHKRINDALWAGYPSLSEQGG